MTDCDCVGLEPNGVVCISEKENCVDATSELRDAVDIYLDDNRAPTMVAGTYDLPIGA
jgi:hypothetical protein